MTDTFPISIDKLIDLGATAIIAIIAIYFLFLLGKTQKDNGKIMEILKTFEENHFGSIQGKLERMDEKLNKIEKVDDKLDKIITLIEIVKEKLKKRK